MTQHGALTAAAAMRIAAAVQSLNGEVLVETRAPCGLSGYTQHGQSRKYI